MSRKTLLILAASLYQLDAIRTALRLGYRVVTTDNVPSNPGHAMADKSYLVDTTDLEGVLRIAQKERVDGLISPCTDVAVPTAAYVCEHLGIPGPPFASTRILCDKPAFREFLASNNLPCPEAYRIAGGCAPPSGIWDARKWIIKPDKSSGSKGVFILESEEDFINRVPETMSFSPTGTGVLEEFIDGRQGTCEGMLKDGMPVMAFVTDRQTVAPPFVVTCGHNVPSTLPHSLKSKLIERLAEMWAMLGVTDGPFDCDFVATEDEVYIIEMTPRIGGNSISTLLRKSLDFDLVEYSVKVACGDASELPAMGDPRPTALVLLGSPAAGKLTYDQSEAERLRNENWVDYLDIDVPFGAPVEPFVNGRHRVGESLVFGADATDVAAKVSELRARLCLGAG